jgi:aconitate hydratase
MALNRTQTLIRSHLASGEMKPGEEIGLRIDQALLQDVLGTPVMLELEAMNTARVKIGVQLMGRLSDWVSAKDVILEMLRRHGVEGGFRRVIEYYGPGLAGLSAMDRHVIANMGAELGATTSVFPSDERTLEYLRSVGRETDWRPIAAEEGAQYDLHDEIDLSSLQPLIAKPSSPANVVLVREVAGADIYQAYIGSSANPGFRDFGIAATIMRGHEVHNRASFDINPSSRHILQTLADKGYLTELVAVGARTHQPGRNGCIGMGQAPAAGRISLRTVPRNFPGRSGTREDSVYLCSPETAAASALKGVITDPRDLGMPYERIKEPERFSTSMVMFVSPEDTDEARGTKLEKTANITSLLNRKQSVSSIQNFLSVKTQTSTLARNKI